jgi:hypothetical protein
MFNIQATLVLVNVVVVDESPHHQPYPQNQTYLLKEHKFYFNPKKQ